MLGSRETPREIEVSPAEQSGENLATLSPINCVVIGVEHSTVLTPTSAAGSNVALFLAVINADLLELHLAL